jgi:hypothetical protein
MFGEPAPYHNEALLASLAAGDRKAFESLMMRNCVNIDEYSPEKFPRLG